MTAEPWRRHLPDGRTRWFGIIGSPLEHSLSPRLQTGVLRLMDRNLIYLPLPVSAARLPELLHLGPALGLLGLNVTTPYKEAAFRLVEAADEETRRTEMVNTIWFRPEDAERAGQEDFPARKNALAGPEDAAAARKNAPAGPEDAAAAWKTPADRGEAPVGCGTDGEGILRYLEAAGLAEIPFGVCGFGPTARSLIHRALSRGRPLEVIATRRREEVERTLASWGMHPGKEPAVAGWEELESGGAPRLLPLWISALPVLPEIPAGLWRNLEPGGMVVDLNYGAGRGGLMEEARRRGFPAADGLGPLCHQAALSLSHWLNEEVPVERFYRVLGSPESALRPRR